MPTEILTKSGTPTVWADTTDYLGLLGTRTHQIDLTSLAASGNARQGVKADLGATRAAVYAVTISLNFDVAPSSGDIVSLWWAPSPSATAGTANPGGVSGADAAYTGTAGDVLADSILQLTLIGNLIATSDADTVTQIQTFMFSPEHRYGSPVVYNEADQAFEGDADVMAIAFTPIIDEAQ
jgi:hypothetical protein